MWKELIQVERGWSLGGTVKEVKARLWPLVGLFGGWPGNSWENPLTIEEGADLQPK